MHGEAQTPLGLFVDDILYEQVCNKSTTYQTTGASALVHRRICEQQRSTVDGIVDFS